MPLQLGFDIIPIIERIKSKLEAIKSNNIKSRKSKSELMLDQSKELRKKSKKLDEQIEEIYKEYFKLMRPAKVTKLDETFKQLDKETQRIKKAYQKLMKPATVTKLDKTFKEASRSYEINITNAKDPLMQVHGSDISVENVLKNNHWLR